MSTEVKISPLQLHAQGFAPFPIGLDKKPIIQSWKPYQTAQPDIDTLNSFIDMNPPAWAIATGEAYDLLVIDFDTKDQGFQNAKNMMDAQGLEPTVQTPSGGFHYYTDYPTELTLTTGARILPAIDYRGSGGYVGISGTVYLDKDNPDKGTGEYKILKSLTERIAFESLPAPLLEALASGPTRIRDNGDSQEAPDFNIPDSRRHATLISLLGKLRAAGLSQEAIDAAMLSINESQCKPPLSRDEVLSMAREYPESSRAPALRKAAYVEPPQAFNANEEPERREVIHLFQVEDRGLFIPEGHATTLFSQGGSGKSLTGADYLPLLLATGLYDSIFYPLATDGGVLILDWEADLETHRRYISAIKRGIFARTHGDIGGGGLFTIWNFALLLAIMRSILANLLKATGLN